jgi:hypothetical protein
MNGKLIKASQLDACNGIFSATPEFPSGIYHYVLLDTKTAQSSLRCYHGVVSLAHTNFTSALYQCGGFSNVSTLATARLSDRPKR